MDDIKHVMVLTRSTEYCKKAIHYGITMAKKFDAELYVMHSIYNPFGLKGWNLPLPSLTTLEDEYESMQKKAKSDLDNIINSENDNDMKIEVIVSTKNPKEEIFRFLKEKEIDLLIMRAHEEWRLEHFLFGQNNEEIIRKMPCSIMLVKDEPRAVS